MSTEQPARSMFAPIVTPQHFREARPGVEGFRLVSATLTVTLMDDSIRARFAYDCHLETTGEVPARYWCYHLPAEADEVAEVRAWDARGKLYPRLYVGGDGLGARLEVRLREPVVAGERYSFGYGYESTIRSVVAAGRRFRTVTYSDWVIFNVACGVLSVHVELPGGADPLVTVPAAEDEGGRLTYRARKLRPLETVMFSVGYRQVNRPRAACMRAAAAVAGVAMLGTAGG